jgi:Galactose oxidase, central domain
VRLQGRPRAMPRRATRTALTRALHALALCALATALALSGLSDAAFSGEDSALSTIALRPAAARLLAEARSAPIVLAEEGAGFALTTRALPRSQGRTRGTSRRVIARLPRDAAGPIAVGVAGEGRQALVRRAFAGAAAGRLAGGALVYTEAAPGIDAVWFARGDDAEELLVVRAGAAPIAYDLELPAGSTLIAPPGFPGLVEVRDARGEAWLRMTADAAWDAHGQPVPIAVRAEASRVWIDVPASAPRPVVVDPTWTGAGRLAFGRAGHTATVLGTGRVLITGGQDDETKRGSTAELYDPSTGRFTATVVPMAESRAQHSATLLRDGKVLLQGGLDADDNGTVLAELFDPVSGQFRPAGRPSERRARHTATMLQDGRVLVVGGEGDKTAPRSAELFAASGFVAVATPLRKPRIHHTATPLADGRVLLAGGDGEAAAGSIELFDPASSSFVPGAGDLASPRREHTATLLRDGLVLIAGGIAAQSSGPIKIDPHTAELVDPTGRIATVVLPMPTARAAHTATLLPSGKVLLAGGSGDAGATYEIFDPKARSFSAKKALLHPRHGGQTATLLPSGAVLLAGGHADDSEKLFTAEVELFDPLDDKYTETAAQMVTTHIHHTSTRLLNGRVLIFGGLPDTTTTPVVERYDRGVDGFSVAGLGNVGVTSPQNRNNHTATRLLKGKVLIAGGSSSGDVRLATTLLYDPEIDKFTDEIAMEIPRDSHAATALPTGEVLITGGYVGEGGVTTAKCELYDPVKHTFTATKGDMATRRALHTATLLPSGEVLIVGGASSVVPGVTADVADELSDAELYNPGSGKFRPAGALVGSSPPAGLSTATLLPSGEVLILGRGTPQLYDPASGEFRVNVNASGDAPRLYNHTATLLPSGRVLIAGGTINEKPLPWPRIYTPATGEFESPEALEEGAVRLAPSATLLASGEVLITGGQNPFNKLPTARRWSEAPGAPFQPQISGTSGALRGDTAVTIRGDWGGRGSDSADGSSGSSASNHPIVVWMPWGGGALVGNTGAWSLDTAIWTVPHAGLGGGGLLFVNSGGVVSQGKEIVVLPGLACTSNLDCSAGEACSPEGNCVGPVVSGEPTDACAMSSGAPARGSPAIALLLGLAAALAAIRRGGRARPTSPDRAGGWWRRRRGRRAPARRRA